MTKETRVVRIDKEVLLKLLNWIKRYKEVSGLKLKISSVINSAVEEFISDEGLKRKIKKMKQMEKQQ